MATLKDQIRKQFRQLRLDLSNKDRLSEQVLSRVLALECYQRAKTILYYVDVRDEVRTQSALRSAISTAKRIGVPYCDGDSLKCVALQSMAELDMGAYGILEPTTLLKQTTSRLITPEEIDLVLVPGVAFDLHGGRLGHGKGYYDRLLEQVRPDCIKVGIAFECQLAEEVPTECHDVLMNCIVTEMRTLDTSSFQQ